MELESKERTEGKKQNESDVDRNSNSNGVVITVYTESVRTSSRKKTKQGTYSRALLLAHSRDLRNTPSQNVPLPTKTKTKVITN